MSHRKFTDEQALEAIKDKNCISVAAVLRKLGFQKVSGPRHALIKKIAAKYRIDTSHWLGCRYMLGKVSVNRKPLSMILVLNGSKIRSHDVKLRILRDGLKPHQCEKCKKKRWNGQPIPLDLHHKNGNRQDNRPLNIELLCPNCHAQTPNYCGKAIPLKRAVAQQEGGVSLKN